MQSSVMVGRAGDSIRSRLRCDRPEAESIGCQIKRVRFEQACGEISVLRRQCLGRCIDDPKRLRNQIAAWQRRRHKTPSSHHVDVHNRQARTKLGRAYPATAKKSQITEINH